MYKVFWGNKHVKKSGMVGSFILVLFLAVLLKPPVGQGASVDAQSHSLKCSFGTRNVQAVYIDLNDSSIQIEAEIAGGQIGKVDSLANIAARSKNANTEVVAAINGTFFSAYQGIPFPWGTIQSHGNFHHLGNTGTAVGFTRDNQFLMDSLYVSIKGGVNGSYEWPNNWYAWGFNHHYTTPDAISIFTPAYGNTTGPHSYTSAVVENQRVVQVAQGQARIPANGYTIVFGDSRWLDCFKIGNQLSYRLEYNRTEFSGGMRPGGPISWENVCTTIGAGPSLLKNGSITANGAAEGFSEDKITTNRGQRSFIGIRPDRVLVMGTVPNVSIRELAEVAQKLGLTDAMNLDGGASSGLLYKGKYLTTPGRLLSNALVVTQQKGTPAPVIRVLLDGKYLSFDTPPINESGRLLVPMRRIFESLGATVHWDPTNNTATAIRNDRTVRLQIGAREAFINGQAYKLEPPGRIVGGRTLVPLRFVSEAFGAEVKWDGTTQTVTITSPNDVIPIHQPAGEAPAFPGYLGNVNSMQYHRMDCHLAGKETPDDIVVFESKKEAEAAGYIPCKQCCGN